MATTAQQVRARAMLAGNVVAATSQASRDAGERPRMMQRNTTKVRVLARNIQPIDAGVPSNLGSPVHIHIANSRSQTTATRDNKAWRSKQ